MKCLRASLEGICFKGTMDVLNLHYTGAGTAALLSSCSKLWGLGCFFYVGWSLKSANQPAAISLLNAQKILICKFLKRDQNSAL